MSKLKLPKTIKMVLTDFDGIITDGCVYIDENGSISRKINFKDVMGIHLLKKNDIKIGIISGESNSAIEMLSKRFAIDEIHQNIRVKIDVVKSIVEKYELSEDEFLYIGDDVNDLESLTFAKHRVTVPNGVEKLKKIKGIKVTKNKGGDGAFREVADCLIG